MQLFYKWWHWRDRDETQAGGELIVSGLMQGLQDRQEKEKREFDKLMHEKEKLVRIAEAKEHSIQVQPLQLAESRHQVFIFWMRTHT